MWQKQYFLTKYCYWFSKSAEIPMNWDFQFTWTKNIAGKISFYRNIALSFYRNIACQNRSSDECLTDGIKSPFLILQILDEARKQKEGDKRPNEIECKNTFLLKNELSKGQSTFLILSCRKKTNSDISSFESNNLNIRFRLVRKEGLN